ncbi:MAG: L,D-transpeptidase [Actinomycetota bacterium]|nr:L,D-transpeptidase [Actinomycetota bacterium]
MARVLILAAALLVVGCGADPRPRAVTPEPAPALRASLDGAQPKAEAPVPEGRHLVAHLERPVQLRSAPGGRVVARLATRTEFGSRMALNVVSRRDGWLEVLATPRPNGRTGWIPADAARLKGTDFEIRIDRSARRLELRRGRRVLRRATVGIGRPANPTPLGRFAVTDRLTTASSDSPYGCCAIALTGHQTKLVPGWPGGDRLAIHGTPQTETIGAAASLGCLRAARADLEYLLGRLPLGTPVFIRA